MFKKLRKIIIFLPFALLIPVLSATAELTPKNSINWAESFGGINISGVSVEGESEISAEFAAENRTGAALSAVVPIFVMYELSRDCDTNMLVPSRAIGFDIGEAAAIPAGGSGSFEVKIDLTGYNTEGRDFVFTLYLWDGLNSQKPIFIKNCWYYIEI
jgi:hypothetical protein